MPRKKLNNIEPQPLEPIAEPIAEEMPETPERIMPQMDWQPEQPKHKTHYAGFLMLFLALALAVSAIYYWPDYGLRDFIAIDDQHWSPVVIHRVQDNKPQESATAWKTYSNQNFTIMYPPTDEVTGDFAASNFITIHGSGATSAEGSAVTVELIKKSITQVRGEIGSSQEGNITSAKDVKFNTYDAREIILKGTEPTRIILISHAGGTYKITHYLGASEDILATFKFND